MTSPSRPWWKAALMMIVICGLPLAVAAADPPAAPDVAAPRPNVVFLLVDDLDLSVYQSGLDAGLYPNLKNLLAAGTSFSNTFVSLSICCPSRATYLTGQYGHNHGTIRNVGPKGGFRSFKDASTLGVWLKAGGYRTGFMGKYMNGYKEDAVTYVPPGWDTWNVLLSLSMYDYTMTVPGGSRTYGSAEADYQTDVYAHLADAFIRQPGSQPFYLGLNPSAPHLEGEGEYDEDEGGDGIRPPLRYAGTPSVPLPARSLPSFNENNMLDKPIWLLRKGKVDPGQQERVWNEKRVAMRAVDDMVGKLVQTLKDIGKWDNTLFVFTSDNGFQYGTHRRNLTKVDFYEESVRIPMVIKAPKQKSGKVSDAWVLNNDWAPTVLDYAGLAPGDGHVFDGRSLRPLVSGTADAGSRRTVMTELPPDGRSSAHPPFYALRSKDPALTLDPTGNTVLVYAETLNERGTDVTDREFYDLTRDPYQVDSLHRASVPERVRQRQLLKARLDALKNCVGAGCKALED